jgi:glutathione peroxidase
MVYEFKVKKANGTEVSMKDFEGKVLLIVNVASECGFTKQYEGLEKLYEKYQSRGLEILGFPCNQFGGQEPGTDEEIQSFCTGTFGIKFPIFSKVDVNGDNAAPLFNYLKKEAKGILGTEAIKWNFTKFLISKTGQVVDRYAPTDTPESLEKHIEKLL